MATYRERHSVGRLDEIHLNVNDLPRTRKFYADVLGFGEAFYEARMPGFISGDTMLVLTASRRGASGVSLGFTCRESRASSPDTRSPTGEDHRAPGWALGRVGRGHRGT